MCSTMVASVHLVTFIILVGLLQVEFGACSWHYCYSCSHSESSPSTACINATDTSLVMNCSTGFCYSYIEYDKDNLKIVSMLRRCQIKDLGTQCYPPGPAKLVCIETCQDDYCNTNAKLYGDDASAGTRIHTVTLPILTLLTFILL